jgi:integrase
MPLTDTRIRNTKPGRSPIKLADGKGLYLEVRPTGAKLWRYRYRIANKENVFAAGEYAQPPGGETKEATEARIRGGRLTLEEARAKRHEWRGLVKQGIHPAHHRQALLADTIAASANTFQTIAEEWLAKKSKDWTPKNRARMERVLKREVFPNIGRLPIRQVTPAHLLHVMQRVDADGAPTVAILIRQWCYRIFNHAIATLRADTNPAAGDIREAITRPKTKNHPALTPADIKPLVTAIVGYGGEPATKIALKLLMLTFVRSVELRGAEWSEFDLDEGEWRIPASRMKMRRGHVVPLAVQTVTLLKELSALTGRHKLLFPNSRTPGTYMASTTLNAALVRLGYEGRFSPHGFRSTASTILNEMGYRPDWIERQLAHKGRDTVREIYNRAEYLAERRGMMQQWADYIDASASDRGKVLPGRFGLAA